MYAVLHPRTTEGYEADFAGVAARADQRDKLDRPGGAPLCRYIARPAVSEKRLSLTASGQVRYQLKTPYSDGTTHVIFDGAAMRPIVRGGRTSHRGKEGSGDQVPLKTQWMSPRPPSVMPRSD